MVLLIAAFGLVIFSPVPICPTRTWLHVPCPGCGATRAIFMALRGDFHGAFHTHPLAVPAAVLLLPTALLVFAGILKHDVPPPLPRWLRLTWYVFVGAMIALWLARFAGMFGGPVPI